MTCFYMYPHYYLHFKAWLDNFRKWLSFLMFARLDKLVQWWIHQLYESLLMCLIFHFIVHFSFHTNFLRLGTISHNSEKLFELIIAYFPQEIWNISPDFKWIICNYIFPCEKFKSIAFLFKKMCRIPLEMMLNMHWVFHEYLVSWTSHNRLRALWWTLHSPVKSSNGKPTHLYQCAAERSFFPKKSRSH